MYIKGDGGAVSLTDNPSALWRRIIAGPEVARMIEEFHNEQNHHGGKVRKYRSSIMTKHQVFKLHLLKMFALLSV